MGIYSKKHSPNYLNSNIIVKKTLIKIHFFYLNRDSRSVLHFINHKHTVSTTNVINFS